MSYPSELASRVKQLQNYSTNNVKLVPNNGRGQLDITSGGQSIVFTMPPNSLIDLSTFSVHADFSTRKYQSGDDHYIPNFLCRNANNLISRMTVSVGGTSVCDIKNYNLIQNIFMDYQYGVEGVSKRLLNNPDALDKRLDNGVFRGPRSIAAGQVAGNPTYVSDSRPITLNNFISFLGGDPKMIDTQVVGEVRVELFFENADYVLFRGEAEAAVGANPDPAQPNTPQYTLANIYATIKKATIEDGVYYNSIAMSLNSGLPFQFMYNEFRDIQGSICDKNTVVRYDIQSASVDLLLATFYAQTHTNYGRLEYTGRGAEADAFVGNTKYEAYTGKNGAYTTSYFRRNGTGITKCVFNINGERVPNYDMSLPLIYGKTLEDMNIHDDTLGGVFVGIGNYDNWVQNYFVASCRLSNTSSDKGWISGFNSQGLPLVVSAEFSADGQANAFIPHLIVMTTSVMNVFAGRNVQISR